MKRVNDIEGETSAKRLLLTSEALLYLLFKKLSLGRRFLFSDFEELIESEVITIEKVEEIYRVNLNT